MKESLLPFLLVLALASPAIAEPATYTLDPARCRLVVHLLKGGLASGLAHDHVIRATRLSGSARVDPRRPDASSIALTVDAGSLKADEPWLRRQYGMSEMLDAGDRAKVEGNLRAADQLDTARHRIIRFVSGRIKPSGADRFDVQGTLTLRGVSRPVRFMARAAIRGRTFKASGMLRFRQSEFGYQPYSAAGGLVKVKDLVTLNVFLEGALLTPPSE